MSLTQNVFVNTAVYAAAIPLPPTHDHSAGVVTPHCGNGAMSLLRNVIVTGYYTGIVCNEHTDGDAINGAQFFPVLKLESCNCHQRLKHRHTLRRSHHLI